MGGAVRALAEERERRWLREYGERLRGGRCGVLKAALNSWTGSEALLTTDGRIFGTGASIFTSSSAVLRLVEVCVLEIPENGGFGGR